MKKLLITTLCLVYSSLAFSSNHDIGVKGLYIGQNGNDACALINNNFSKEGKFVDKAENEPTNHQGLEVASRVCYIEESIYSEIILVTMDSKDKVKEIRASYKAFGIYDMPMEEFAQKFVDNYSWVNTLSYKENKYFPDTPGNYVFQDDENLGFKLTISKSQIVIKTIPLKEPVPTNNPSFN